MAYWLADARRGQAEGVLSRFDPAYWTVNFPRPMMASVVTTAPDALRVDAVFYRQDDLAGLIWEAEDRHDHPLLRYETARDFRDCRLRFRWRASGVKPLDAVNGPVLTIEGRDAAGDPRAWYVRLWNYAEGTAEDALVSIDFATVQGGFLLPGEADPVWAGDVDRMFVSLVAPGHSGADADLAAPAEGWVELSQIACEGPGSVLAIGDVIVPEHGLEIANGYDDNYHLTPERLLRNMMQLGWRGAILHYVGMSHYFRLEASSGGHYASLGATALNVACRAWHADYARRARALGYALILSLSYELFDRHCWGDWKQRAADGSPALTGWEPPSTLLSPAHAGAMAYLQAVAREFAGIAKEAGLRVRFQIGEPWWWTLPDGSLCIHDAAARAALAGASDVPAAAGALLAASTLALRDAVRAVDAGAEVLLLVYTPTALTAPAANVPIGWAAPAFDVLQLEDYDWAATGHEAASVRGIAAVEARLGYSVTDQHYLAGFVLRPEDRRQWRHIEAAAARARRRGVARTFLWALPQVLRDGFVHFDQEEAMDAFDDVLFPLALGREAEVAPEVSTSIVTSAGGQEKRNAEWAEARTHYDVGPGLRSEDDIAELLAFFRARMGPARGFRLRDPFDCEALDELIGTGDGTTARFAPVRRYGDVARRITRPIAATVRIAIDGAETGDFALGAGGMVTLGRAPAAGAAVRASFVFDVPVRFADDRLQVSRATFLAGALASVPLVEIRE
ncbi:MULTISPECIES: DUF2460 domain-containing protein [unclassified Sphingomonas]|uniref:DUF2460 domain-containing protein n=1 Tax=Sphingomonas TaxID=13687 RepID=UPI00095FCF5A|nr:MULTISPECIES: DUF2460 domain-containing protein [unclassified Sphingomonas]MBN8809799.1 DUF2460 domain-containing protein [Sphingomonas sp.]OJY50423.1 MAG: hypothetical protein BGP17_18380 [Sphingomonas sp. 67-41]